MRKFITPLPAIAVLLATTAVLFAAPAAVRQIQLANLAAQVTLAQATLDNSGVLNAIAAERAAVHDAVMPGVVHIVTTPRRNAAEAETDFRFGIGRAAAGWFWDDQGHVITNAHVVEDAFRIRVEFFDGRVREGQVVGVDRRTDIAVVRVSDVPGTIPLRRATSVPVRVGEVCFVLGSPFNIKFSMSQGTVSGLNRAQGGTSYRLRTGYTNFIQTDAAMNPGNSGGPMVNADGLVIGMASAIANVAERNRTQRDERSFVGQSAGIGFAIPLETVENVVEQLLDRSRPALAPDEPVVIRGYLGVELRDVDPVTARGEGYDGLGVRVVRLFEGSPADMGGLVSGDIIVALEGRETDNVGVLQSFVSVQAPGEPVRVDVWRSGEMITLEFPVGAAFIDPRGDLRAIQGSESMSQLEIERRLQQILRRN
ncbi:MAG: trypsin-like peptidase domain-containing protein [Planctomycetota bacterium]